MKKSIYTLFFHSTALLGLFCVTYFSSGCRNITGENVAPRLPDLVKPSTSVITDSVLYSNIATTTATVTGKLVLATNQKPTQYGFYYSASNAFPTSSDNVFLSKDTAKTGNTLNITGKLSTLSQNTLYYIRAFAVYDSSTFYGTVRNFTTTKNVLIASVQTTSITAISYIAATFQGSVTSGGTNITEYGFVYATTSMPTIANTKIVKSTTAPGTFPFAFTSAITSLQNNTTYYMRAYVKDNSGISYGDNKSFKTLANVTPTVQSGAVTGIGYFTATLSGTITSEGSSDITQYGVVYSTTNTLPTILDSKIITSSSAPTVFPVSFTSSLINLTGATTYYVRTYATNATGTAYGTVQQFTTVETRPKLATTIAKYTGLDQNISVSANIENAGASAITRYGFVYSTTSTTPTLSNFVAEVGTTGIQTLPAPYSSYIPMMGKPAGLYYVRAFATNATGTSYGNAIATQVYFNPVVVTVSGAGVGLSGTASLSGSVTSGGSATITEHGFIYTLTSNATLGFEYGGSGVTALKGSSTATIFPFNYSLTAAPGVIGRFFYSFKSYAITTNGIVYGDVLTFITDTGKD